MERNRYSLTYRAPEVQQVMNWIEGRQPGCLVGLHGTGKSGFLRFLLRQDVRQHYLEQDHTDFAFILINLLALTERTQWALQTLISRLRAKIEPDRSLRSSSLFVARGTSSSNWTQPDPPPGDEMA